MSEGLSLEEMTSGKSVPKAAGGGGLTLADMDPSTRPPPKPADPGLLDNALGGDSDAAVATKGISTAMIKLLSQVPGFYGNLVEGGNALGAAVPAGYNALFNNKDFSQDYDKQIANQEGGRALLKESTPFPLSLIPSPDDYMPSGADISTAIFKHTGQYKPQGALGDLGMAAAEGVGASIFPGGSATKVNKAGEALDFAATQLPKAKAYVANLISGGAGGAGAEAGMKATDNPWLAGLSGLLGSLTPGWLSHAATGRTLGTAERLAGQTIRDATADPAATQAALENIPSAPLPGAKLTSAQVARDPGLAEIESELAAKNKESGTFAGRIAEDNAASQAALETAAEKAARQAAPPPKEAAWRAANMGSDNAADLSTKARDIFAKAEEAADKVQSDAWKVPEMQGARMFRNKTLGALTDAMDNMNVADSQIIPKHVHDTIAAIEAKYPKGQIPMEEIKSLHSNLLADARKASFGATANPNEARILGKLAGTVRDALFDEGNYSYRAPGMLDAFKAAKQATADYYKTFGPMKDLLASPMAGVEKVASEATLQKLMGGQNAPQNMRLFRDAVGPAADDLLSDFVVSDITGHGMKLPHPEQVEKYMLKNAGKIDEIPGLEARLNSLKTASRADLVSQGIATHAVKPEKLFEFLESNADDVKAVFKSPQQKELLENIKDTARRLSKIPEGEIGSKETFNKVTNGRVLDVLLGSASAKMMGLGTGVALGKTAEHLGLSHADAWTELLGAAGALAHGSAADIPGRVAQHVFMGNNAERVQELLMEGLRDPKVGAMLMKKADPANVAAVFQKVNPNVASTMPVLSESTHKPGYKRGGRVQLEKSRALLRKATAPLPVLAGG